MAYSTTVQLRDNVKLIDKSFNGVELDKESFSTAAITFADKIVEVDCSQYIDFSLVPDDETTDVVNLLSQYKSAEMALRRLVGVKRRTQENDDISEWRMMYDELKQKIKDGVIDVTLGDGSVVSSTKGKFKNTARPNVRPSQGYDKYGEWLNNDDMYELRGDVTTRKYD